MKFYLETSERSMETHAVQMPVHEINGLEETHIFREVTFCGHSLDATWWAVDQDSADKEPWPTCTKCYQSAVAQGAKPHNQDPDGY